MKMGRFAADCWQLAQEPTRYRVVVLTSLPLRFASLTLLAKLVEAEIPDQT
jgi:hypothetical protein